MNSRMLLPTALLIALLIAPGLAEPPAEPPVEPEAPAHPPPKVSQRATPTHADEAKVEELLTAHKKAVATKDAVEIQTSLEALALYDNKEFLDPAMQHMKYKLSSVDKKVVQALARKRGVTKAKRIRQMCADREQIVQRAAADLLANYPGKDTEKVLHKFLRDKRLFGEKPQFMAKIIESMGRIGYTKAYDEIEKEFRKLGDKYIMRAAVLCWGLTKEKRAAKMLCDHVDEPAPGSVNSPTNPPASYWEARWKAWDHIRYHVPWALQEITGYEKEFTTSKQARDWIKRHGRKVGIR